MGSDSEVKKEEKHKNRSRKKQLYSSIVKQMEFYFSDANLGKGRFMRQRLLPDNSIELCVFLSFNKIRSLTTDMDVLIKALKKSEILEVSEEKLTVRRLTPIQEKENQDECVIYVEQIPPDADHDWIRDIFSQYGVIDYISIPKFKSGKPKGFAFVEFATPECIQKVVQDYKKAGNYLSTEMAPEELCSIVAFKDGETEEEEGESETKRKNENSEVECESQTEDHNSVKKPKKRKLSDEMENGVKTKKEKIDHSSDSVEQSNSAAENEMEGEGIDLDKKKKRKRRKKRKSKKDKVTAESSGLQILTKMDWKRLRNTYLNTQKKKMNLLKKHLSQKQKIMQQQKKNAMETEMVEPLSYPSCFTPGVVVKALLPQPVVEVKHFKDELKTLHSNVKYIDVKEGATEIFVRLDTHDSAIEFCKNSPWENIQVLEGEEESKYWEKIENDRAEKCQKKNIKERGKKKLLKKAEKALGKHIVFEELENESTN